MEEKYDVIVLGTGFEECLLSGLLSVAGKKVLHMDRNGYYGAEAASLNLEQLWQKFEGKAPPAEYGRTRDYNIDMCPKFIMGCGNLVKLLLHTKVTHYIEFRYKMTSSCSCAPLSLLGRCGVVQCCRIRFIE